MENTTQIIQMSSITVSSRIRKDTGGIDELATDIKVRGLINPITVMDCGNDQYLLIAGLRRLEATRSLGDTAIRATIFTPLAADELLSMEYAENIQRKDFNVAERLEYADKIKAVEKAKARERQALYAGGRDPKKPVSKSAIHNNLHLDARPELAKGDARDAIAKKAGFSSGRQYERAETVAERRPDLLDKIDAGEATIYEAYKLVTSDPKQDFDGHSESSIVTAVQNQVSSKDKIISAGHNRLMKNHRYAKLHKDLQAAMQDANCARSELNRKATFFANQVKHFESNINALKRERDELKIENTALRAKLNIPAYDDVIVGDASG